MVIRPIILGVTAALLLWLSTTAHASGNPPTKILEAESAGSNTYGLKNWMQGLSVTWCGSSMQDAITGWEAVIPGTQFVFSCSNPNINVLTGQCSGGSQVVACVSFTWWWDSVRSANYLTGGFIKLDQDYTYASTAARTTVYSHELGHLAGLDERYYSDFGCNPSENSAMDALQTLDYVVYTGCDGQAVGPKPIDTSRANAFYTVWQAPALVSSWASGSQMTVEWVDKNWLEQYYPHNIYRWDSGSMSWIAVHTIWVNSGVGPGDYVSPGALQLNWVRWHYNQPPGTYLDCIQVNAYLYGTQGWICAPWQGLS